jgi:glycosyl transferase, family 25
MNTIDDIKHAYYINLEHRTDRKAHIEEQLSKVGISAIRFNAIKMKNGAVGCSMSHLKILQDAYANKYEHVLIMEDDIKFLDPDLFKMQLNKFLRVHGNNWDVILLAGNNMPPYTPIDETCIQVSRCQTTTGYLVNGHYIRKLMDNIKMGLTHLISKPDQHRFYAIDKFWFTLQNVDRWFLIIPPTIVQRPDYSDIEKRHTNYQSLMTDLNKEEMMKQLRMMKMKKMFQG